MHSRGDPSQYPTPLSRTPKDSSTPYEQDKESWAGKNTTFKNYIKEKQVEEDLEEALEKHRIQHQGESSAHKDHMIVLDMQEEQS